MEGFPRKPMAPQKGTAFKRDSESRDSGAKLCRLVLMDDTETHTACLTPDGVLLRVAIDGQIVMQARSVLSLQGHLSFLRCRLAMSQLSPQKVVRANEVTGSFDPRRQEPGCGARVRELRLRN